MKKTPKIRCDCGGVLKPATLAKYDFTPYAGIPVHLSNVRGYRCSKCGDESIDGATINHTLNLVAYELTQIPNHRLNGAAARYLRKRLGFTQARLAEAMDISRETVADWERGARDISAGYDHMLRTFVFTLLVRTNTIATTSLLPGLIMLRREKPLKSVTLPKSAIEDINKKLQEGVPTNMIYEAA